MDATRDKNNGESPKMDMLVPEATPMYCGNDLVAAKRSEKYL